eukprot:TRINITY_DN1154_c0_g1_i1.p1 TRINITY_DN1154_c0_g1~~TRINITY_DN1154_c0_g1_i1.p1  ORF type:complete len:214 (+),score=37.29 TRINITY_DN1154_c0_g1_i1:60-701(+)
MNQDLNIALLISKALGFGIIAGATLLKVPQIKKIMSSKSVQGLSFSMYILELIGYIIMLAYSYNNGFSFSTYGEYYAIALQNLIIIYLLYSYTNQLGVFFTMAAGLAVFVYALFSGLITLEQQTFLQAMTIPIFTLSKIPQIWLNFKNKNIGQLSVVTVFMMFAGTAARVFTTLTEISAPIVLLGYVIGAVLNGTLLLQALIYGGAKPDKKKA